MRGYLKGSRLIALSDLLTGRNKLHLPWELCVVSKGFMRKRRTVNPHGKKSLEKLQKWKMKTQVLFGYTFCYMVGSLNFDATIFSTECLFYTTKEVMPIFRVLSTSDSVAILLHFYNVRGTARVALNISTEHYW